MHANRREPSTNQVVKPVNLGALTSWVGHIPPDVKRDMSKLAPMLDKLGYDPNAYPPNYGTPDKEVLENEKKLKANADQWAKNMQAVEDNKKKTVDDVIAKNREAWAKQEGMNRFNDRNRQVNKPPPRPHLGGPPMRREAPHAPGESNFPPRKRDTYRDSQGPDYEALKHQRWRRMKERMNGYRHRQEPAHPGGMY